MQALKKKTKLSSRVVIRLSDGMGARVKKYCVENNVYKSSLFRAAAKIAIDNKIKLEVGAQTEKGTSFSFMINSNLYTQLERINLDLNTNYGSIIETGLKIFFDKYQ